LTIDPNKRQVSLDGELVELRNTEYRLLVLLAENPGRVIPLAEITGHLWNSNSPEALARLDVQVSSLRGKLGETGRRPGYLRRIRGVGIALTPLQH
jgi:DNA-binding response OmpR family regulator